MSYEKAINIKTREVSKELHKASTALNAAKTALESLQQLESTAENKALIEKLSEILNNTSDLEAKWVYA